MVDNTSYQKNKNNIRMLRRKENLQSDEVSENIKLETIKLKDKVKVPSNLFYCSRIIENGKIVCKVFCELDITFDDESEFLKYFDIE